MMVRYTILKIEKSNGISDIDHSRGLDTKASLVVLSQTNIVNH